MRLLALTVLLLLCAGCHRSGTWTDSPKNWERAFGQKPPADIKITHSRYWRSPHFTLEFEYFFQIEPSEKLRKEFNAEGRLESFTPSTKDEQETIQRFFEQKPEWFIPKSLDHYEIWKGKASDRDYERFRLFIDRETGTMFMTDFSV